MKRYGITILSRGREHIEGTIRRLLHRLDWFLFDMEPRKVCYIGGSEVLPPPLSAEEERELIQQMRIDPESVRTILIERNLRLVVYIAKKFEHTMTNVEDLISIGTIGLIKAVNTVAPQPETICNKVT